MAKRGLQDQIEASVKGALDRLGVGELEPRQKAALRMAELRKRLLDPETTAYDVSRVPGLSTPEERKSFQTVVGCTPHRFVLSVRMELAARLLSTEKTSVAEVARLVGYTAPRSLRRAFRDYHERSPSATLSEEHSVELLMGENVEDSTGSPPPDLWRLFLRGAAGEAVEEWFLEKVNDLLNDEALPHQAVEFEGSKGLENWEKLLARHVGWCWSQRDRSDVLGDFVLVADHFQTPALFEYLLEQSRVAGRSDREKGVWIAELALESLKGLEWRLSTEELAHHRIRGWSYLGHAQRLSFDYPGAEQAFSRARKVAAAHEPVPALIMAELSLFEAGLRLYQRRRQEAAQLLEDTTAYSGPKRARKLQVEATLLKGMLKGFEGRWLDALLHFEQASADIEVLRDKHLLLSLESGSVWANFKTQRFKEGEAALSRAFDLARCLEQPSAFAHLYWLKGIGAAERNEIGQATAFLRKAFDGFLDCRVLGHAAVVALELAIVLSWRGRHEEVLEVARTALPVLQELELNDECLVLIGLLEKAIQERKIESALLWRLRSRLGAELGLFELLKNENASEYPPAGPIA